MIPAQWHFVYNESPESDTSKCYNEQNFLKRYKNIKNMSIPYNSTDRCIER